VGNQVLKKVSLGWLACDEESRLMGFTLNHLQITISFFFAMLIPHTNKLQVQKVFFIIKKGEKKFDFLLQRKISIEM